MSVDTKIIKHTWVYPAKDTLVPNVRTQSVIKICKVWGVFKTALPANNHYGTLYTQYFSPTGNTLNNRPNCIKPDNL